MAKWRVFKRENAGWYMLFSFIIGIWCLITMLLFVNTLISSFKSNNDILNHPWSLIPQKIIFDNYIKLVQRGFLRFFVNSFLILIVSIAVNLAVSTPCAYGLGKFKFKGNAFLRRYFLFGMMFPVQLGIIPLYNLIRNMGLLDNLLSVILIYSAGVSIPVFILTNFTQNVPDELRQAARIDGAGEWKIFTSIFIPLMRPAIAALLPLLAVNVWNDFFIPLVFIQKDELRTVPLGLLSFFSNHGFQLSYIGIVFAAMAISMFPLLALYLAGSRNIIGGLTAGAVK
ncbi:MAG: carbohydrate ABC transporter permease [Treponema sp.]|nr:carbohydrate ABC transporter permease [Treponema sp.]